MGELRWCLDFSYAEVSKRWEDGAVVFHPFSGDTFELNELADYLLCCLDGQHSQTTASLIGQAAAVYVEVEELLPQLVDDTLQSLQECRLVRTL